MPFLLLIVGGLAVLSAIRGTYQQLGSQLYSDLTGSAGNVGFMYWISAIVVVGAFGYYTPAQKFSRMFMVLILLGMVLANNTGLFARLAQAVKNPVQPQPSTPTTTQGASPTGAQPQQTSALTGSQALKVGAELIGLG